MSYDTEIWPDHPGDAAPAVLLGALGAGLVAAILLPHSLPGVGLLIVAAALVAGAWPLVRLRRNPTSVGFALLAGGLVTMTAVRSATWILTLSIALALALFSYALAGGRSWPELVLGGLSWPAAAERMPGWLTRGVRAHRPRRSAQLSAGVRAVAVGVVLVAFFGGLLASADAVFDRLVDQAAPDLSQLRLPARLVGFVLIAGATLAAGYLAANRPRWHRLTAGEPKPARPIEWLIPIVLVNLVLLVFAGIQATVLVTDDRDALLRSTGMTYAEYARQGFFQLVWVTIGVLAVIAVAVRRLPAGSGRTGAVAQALLGLLCGLSLVVVASALSRIWLYERAYGLTRLRLWVHAFELWLGLVVVLVLVAGGLRLIRRGPRVVWLPRAVAGTGALGLLVLGAINPDALIARSQVERYQRTGELDAAYLAGLSPDAVPALDRLPEPHRTCVLSELEAATGLDLDRPWTRWSWGRQQAEQVLAERPVPAPAALGPACPLRTRIWYE